jgi:hypothetical protein
MYSHLLRIRLNSYLIEADKTAPLGYDAGLLDLVSFRNVFSGFAISKTTRKAECGEAPILCTEIGAFTANCCLSLIRAGSHVCGMSTLN